MSARRGTQDREVEGTPTGAPAGRGSLQAASRPTHLL